MSKDQKATPEKQKEVKDILGRLKECLNLKLDNDLCKVLGIEPSALSMQITRGKIVIEPIISICYEKELNWKYILYNDRSQKVKSNSQQTNINCQNFDALLSQHLKDLKKIENLKKELKRCKNAIANRKNATHIDTTQHLDNASTQEIITAAQDGSETGDKRGLPGRL